MEPEYVTAIKPVTHLRREPLLLAYYLMDDAKRRQFRRAARNLHKLRTQYPLAFTDWDETDEGQ